MSSNDHTAVEVSMLPVCDLCNTEDVRPVKLATIDGKTVMGPWANMCDGHFALVGVGLGLGLGQRLVLKK